MSALTSTVSMAVRGLVKVADTTTAAAGAVGGAVVSGAVGGVQGAAAGVRNGLGDGSRSTAAAALTLGAIGAAGLVEWPLVVAVGGAALVVHQLGRRAADSDQALPTPAAAPRKAAPAKATGTPRKTARKASGQTARRSAPR
jgi:hypothetical protein